MQKQDFAGRFCRRVKMFRESAAFTQESIAAALGIPRDTYAKYEIRSPLPHQYLAPFAQLCDTTVDELLSLDLGMPPSVEADAMGIAWELSRLPKSLRDRVRGLVSEMFEWSRAKPTPVDKVGIRKRSPALNPRRRGTQ